MLEEIKNKIKTYYVIIALLLMLLLTFFFSILKQFSFGLIILIIFTIIEMILTLVFLILNIKDKNEIEKRLKMF